jgi:hypothetical protein
MRCEIGNACFCEIFLDHLDLIVQNFTNVR